MSDIRVRIPPSPTGWCHVGTARAAVVNYLFARHNSGTIVFRSEDTDKERSKREYEDDIVEQLHWLGLSWEKFYRTTEVIARHTEEMRKLIDADKAYVSKEESKKEPGTMTEVIRLRNPGRTITFTDVLRGDITANTTDLGDFVIARAIDDPLYNFAVVVDDAADEITHVIRGEDHISNTPRQIMIQEALGYPRPVYTHYPLHLGSDRSKLSKRKGNVAVKDYREEGYLPGALINFIATLGWTPPSGREVMSLEEMVSEFELKDLHKSGAVFDMEKLRWYNREYLLRISDEAFSVYVLPSLEKEVTARSLQWSESVGKSILPLIRERIHTNEDIAELATEGEFDYFFADPQPEAAQIPEKKSSPSEAGKHLKQISEFLDHIPEQDWTIEPIKAAIWEYATAEGRGAVLWPLRYALTGHQKSPDPFIVASIIGKEASLRRIGKAQDILGSL